MSKLGIATLMILLSMAASATDINGANISGTTTVSYPSEREVVFGGSDGAIFFPISGENMMLLDQPLPNSIAFFVYDGIFHILEMTDDGNATIIEAIPYSEGYVWISGKNMQIFNAYSENSTGWWFTLENNPLRITASPEFCDC